MKASKKSLLASGVSLLASAALLAGATFAWFTDSVTNTGNKIESGKLAINAYAYDLAADGTQSFTIEGVNGGEAFAFEATPQDLKTDKTPIIDDTLFEPGKSNAKLLKVENAGTLAAKLILEFKVTDNGLMDALWFDFVQVKDGAVVGAFQKRPMSGLETIADGMELPLLAGENVQFILIYGMNESAGNAFMEKTFSADVAIVATQYTEEKDGFGSNQYDKDAAYAAATVDGLKNKLEEGGSVVLGSDITVAPQGLADDPTFKGLVPQMTVTKDTVLDLSGKKLSVDAGDDEYAYVPVLVSVDSGKLTIEGDGVVDAEAGNNSSYGVNVNGGTLEINDGYYYGAMTAVQVQKGTLLIRGGFFDMAETCKAAVPQYAKYIVNVIDRNYHDGTAVISITGGTFVNFDPSADPEGAGTSYVADGYTVVSETQANGDIWYMVIPE